MLAADTDPVDFQQLQQSATPGVPEDLGGLISEFLPYVFYISGFLLLIYLVLGGFQLMTSRGDPKAVSAARAKITNALIGFVVILLSAGIVIMLGTVLKVEVFSDIF